MMKLMIRQFGGSDIAEVSRDAAGQLQLDVLAPELEVELQMLFARLNVGPLELRTGQRVKTPQGAAHQTTIRQVFPGDPDFLRALSDALSRERVAGRRVRGILMEE